MPKIIAITICHWYKYGINVNKCKLMYHIYSLCKLKTLLLKGLYIVAYVMHTIEMHWFVYR